MVLFNIIEVRISRMNLFELLIENIFRENIYDESNELFGLGLDFVKNFGMYKYHSQQLIILINILSREDLSWT